MVTAEAIINAYTKFPKLLQRILGHRYISDTFLNLAEKYKLNDVQRMALINVYNELLLQTYTLNNLEVSIKKDVGLSEKDTHQLMIEFIGKLVLPIAWYVGDVRTILVDLGADYAMYEEILRDEFPEVYTQNASQEMSAIPDVASLSEEEPESDSEKPVNEPTILRNIEDRLASSKGRAEVLLRLTALSQQIEDAVKAKKISEKEGQDLMHSLDALSYAVNTQDLNPLETAAIKRRLKSIIAKLDAASA